jgi:hypothetical protein
MFPLLHMKKERSRVDRIQSPVNDLHKIWASCLVKNHIGSIIPYCSNQITKSHSNPSLNNMIYPIKPIPNYIGYISGWCNIECKMKNSPHTSSERTRFEKMITCFLSIMENTFRAPIPVPFCQIIFCYN